jgi:hypothetical protein
MKPNQTIILQLVNHTGAVLRLPNVILDIGFFTGGRSRYAFRLKPTDQSGSVRISYQDVETERVKNAKESLMDYNTPLSECDDEVRFTLPTMEELRQSHEVTTRWAGHGTTPEYAKAWLTASNAQVQTEGVLADLEEGETVIHLPCKSASE